MANGADNFDPNLNCVRIVYTSTDFKGGAVTQYLVPEVVCVPKSPGVETEGFPGLFPTSPAQVVQLNKIFPVSQASDVLMQPYSVEPTFVNGLAPIFKQMDQTLLTFYSYPLRAFASSGGGGQKVGTAQYMYVLFNGGDVVFGGTAQQNSLANWQVLDSDTFFGDYAHGTSYFTPIDSSQLGGGWLSFTLPYGRPYTNANQTQPNIYAASREVLYVAP